jgi:hypothetical protein
MSAPKPKPQADERLWEPLDRPGVFLTEAEVEAEEDERDRLQLEEARREYDAGEMEVLSIDEMVERGLMTEDFARLLR